MRDRLATLRTAFVTTRRSDPRFLPYLLAALLGPLVVGLVVGLVFGTLVFAGVIGFIVGLTAALVVFGRRAQAAQLASIEGQPGAAASVLQSMRRGTWRITPAVAATRKQDLVHLAVGKPGVVVVGEGSPARVKQLLQQEKRKVARVAGDTPVHELSVGNADGQVPLRKVQYQLARMPRAIKPKQVGELDTKLKALGDTSPPMPKGPVPRGKQR
jgi:hypothetical protein